MADSITEGTLAQWHKSVGDYVKRDELIATVETDKVDVVVNSPEAGTLLSVFSQEGDTVVVGGDLFSLDTDAAPPAAGQEPPAVEIKPLESEAPPPTETTPAPAAASAPTAAPPVAATPPPPPPTTKPKPAPTGPATQVSAATLIGQRTEKRVKMSRMRLKISERLKESQNTAAALTTFNEIDMSNIIEFRNKYKDIVLKKHNVKLGFMSPFVKAAAEALAQVPEVNGRIEGEELVYNDFMDISVAVATPKGLVTPVLRNCENMSLIQIEKTIAELGEKARKNAITIEDMAGGTFTVSNGGVFGSMMGTPIINQPQSAILGMHATKERAVVIDGKVEVRPMMYVALTYDHRIVDGREAVTFLYGFLSSS
ncbi:MAG: hypothetical protein SGCHY_001070 [Lobulomycetales sp.]